MQCSSFEHLNPDSRRCQQPHTRLNCRLQEHDPLRSEQHFQSCSGWRVGQYGIRPRRERRECVENAVRRIARTPKARRHQPLHFTKGAWSGETRMKQQTHGFFFLFFSPFSKDTVNDFLVDAIFMAALLFLLFAMVTTARRVERRLEQANRDRSARKFGLTVLVHLRHGARRRRLIPLRST